MFKNSQFFIAFLQQFIEKMALQPDKRPLIGLKRHFFNKLLQKGDKKL